MAIHDLAFGGEGVGRVDDFVVFVPFVLPGETVEIELTEVKKNFGRGRLRRVLQPGAPAYVTLGSINDPRFGFGDALDERTFAPGDGDEIGIPHAYFERDGIHELLRGFTIESLEEVDATSIVGTWAHPDTDSPQQIVHWFVVATKN